MGNQESTHESAEARILALNDLPCYKTRHLENTFDHFQQRFPDGVPITLEAITGCFDKFSPLDELCFFLDRDQRRRVMSAQLGDLTKAGWLISGLREVGLDANAKALEAHDTENLDGASAALRLLRESKTAVKERAEQLHQELRRAGEFTSPDLKTANELELQLRLILEKLLGFDDAEWYKPEWYDVVFHGNAFDENTARYIVEELNGRPRAMRVGL